MSSSALSSPTILAEFEGLDYSKVESAFADLRFENGFLVIDTNTETQFSIVLEHLPEGFENSLLNRISFLVRQQFDDNQAQQIFLLLEKVAAYKKQESIWWQENSRASATGEDLDNLKLLFDLQDRVLGEDLAQKLYHEQRRLMRYMTATVAIEKDESLSEVQKQQALDALTKSLEQPKQ